MRATGTIFIIDLKFSYIVPDTITNFKHNLKKKDNLPPVPLTKHETVLSICKTLLHTFLKQCEPLVKYHETFIKHRETLKNLPFYSTILAPNLMTLALNMAISALVAEFWPVLVIAMFYSPMCHKSSNPRDMGYFSRPASDQSLFNTLRYRFTGLQLGQFSK